jgi:hypothetical protein
MPKGMTIKEFINACEDMLRRVESVVKQPLKLQVQLEEFEELLRKEWPDAIIEIKDEGMDPHDRETIEMIFKKIEKLGSIVKSNVSLYDGLEDFLQQSRNS